MLATHRHPAQVQAPACFTDGQAEVGPTPRVLPEEVLSAGWKAVASSHCFPEESGLSL